MTAYLTSQYLASLTMLKTCVENYDAGLWANCSDYKSPAGQIAYHTAFYTNIYLSPSRSRAVRWDKEVPRMEDLGKPITPNDVLSQSDIAHFVDHIVQCIPRYLERFSMDSDCWPNWYSLSQMEFHMNNLRHIQHHVGQLIERNRSIKVLDVPWLTFERIPNTTTLRRLPLTGA